MKMFKWTEGRNAQRKTTKHENALKQMSKVNVIPLPSFFVLATQLAAFRIGKSPRYYV